MNKGTPSPALSRLDSERHTSLKLTFHQSYRDFLGYHGHTFWEFFLVTKGSYKHNYNGEEGIISEGEAYLIRPCDHHAIGFNEPDSVRLLLTVSVPNMKEACLSFSPSLYDELMGKRSLRCSLPEHQIRKIEGLCSYIQKGLGANEEKLELPASLLLYEILSLVIEESCSFDASKPEWLLSLIKQIQNPANKAWRVKEVMEKANYSHSHVSRAFREYMGCSIIDYLTEIKMQNAGDMLRYGDKTIYEIANDLGYKSATNFSAVFKSSYGVSPAEYRKEKRKQRKNGVEEKDLY